MTVVHLDDVRPITWAGDEQGRFLLRAEDTGGAFSYFEVRVPAGQGTVLHMHHDVDETIHVVAGRFEITVGADCHPAGPGTLVRGPHGVAHSFRNVGSETGTLLCISSPGGIERFFEELATLLRRQPPPQPADLVELAAQHRISTYPDQTPPTLQGDNQ